MLPLDLIVFSHLRWAFVFQRPQHLMVRLATTRRVFFIEEPVQGTAKEDGVTADSWELDQPATNVTVARLRVSTGENGFSERNVAALADAIPYLLERCSIDACDAWFYTPLAIPLVSTVPARTVIYDCMDELSAFLNAPAALREREQELLKRADLVFTGGPSLYAAKKESHSRVFCFPSSVDADHFAQARITLDTEPSDQATIPHPRLGFFGVLDERMDLPLIGGVAAERPEFQLVFVGPTVKIDPDLLPQGPNIHYLGQKSYNELPQYLAGWDVCLMPFARNEATRYISPTKTLEYMAAEKPIVSTSIRDVAVPYGEWVLLGDDVRSFVQACDTALHESGAQRERRLAGTRQVLQGTSWDTTAERMAALIDEAGTQHARQTASAQDTRVLPPRSRTYGEPSLTHTTAAVLGGGPTGLSAAYHLGEDALLVEREATVGGWCKSITQDGFIFDYAGHIMFSNDPYVHEMYQMLLGDNVHWQDREAWIYSKNVYTRYPFQGALYGLPVETIKECIVGAIEARFGSLSGKEVPPNATPATNTVGAPPPRRTNGRGAPLPSNGTATHADSLRRKASASVELSGRLDCHRPVTAGESLDDCCADGILESSAPLARPLPAERTSSSPQNFEDFIYRVWGAGIAKHFAIPYNQKLWAVPLAEMETSWLGGRVPLPDLQEMIEGALAPVAKPMGPNARFGYPLRGGFQALMNGFLPHLRDRLWLNANVVQVCPSERTVTCQDGRRIRYDVLISTMPLPVLVRLIGREAPPEIHAAAARLRNVSVRCVHLGINRARVTDKHWIYYPEDSIFHRIFVQSNASPYCSPPGTSGLTCEITYHPRYKPLSCQGQELIDRCINDCRRVGIISSEDRVVTSLEVDLPHAYVVYDHERAEHVSQIRTWLTEHQILLAGRYSEWEYYNSDHAFLAGRKAAEKVKSLCQSRMTSV